MHFLDILEIFRLVMGQITSNLLKKQFAFLSTSIMFCNMFARACAEIKILRAFGCESDLCLLKALRFLFLLFFSFCCSIWPSTGLASSVKNSEKASSRWAIFLSHVYWQEILLWVFYSTFWACLCISQALLGQSRWSGYHWKDNIIFSCRSWVLRWLCQKWKFRPKAHHAQLQPAGLWPAQESIG